MNFQELKNRFTSREVYLWGARQLGFSILKTLRREGLTPKGFVDSSQNLAGQTVLGLPVSAPETILMRPNGEVFIVITSGFYAEEIGEACRRAGLAEGRDYVAASELQRLDYQIDVSGLCNLKCISCPRGNFSPQPAAGFMKPDVLDQVLAKIVREDPLVGAVALYNWGEPLLNPDLPEMISLCRRHGLDAAISSNLSFRRDFSQVIKARPTWFRVSVSGYGANYEITHTGGRWDWFLENLHTLKNLKDEHHPDMEVEVFYHIYKNRAEDYRRLQELCAGLGFTMRVRHAALAPLENVAAIISGRPVSQAAVKTWELQSISIPEAMEMARAQKHLPCPYARCLWLTWDIKISQCMEWYQPGLYLLEGDFLQVPLDDILAARRDSEFCRSCRERAIHRCFTIYGDESLIEKRGSLNA